MSQYAIDRHPIPYVRNQIQKQFFISALIYITPLTALANGWWLSRHTGSVGSIGQIVAICLQLYSLIILARRSIKRIVIILALISTFMITLLIEACTDGHIISSAIWFSRVVFTVSIFLVVISLLERSTKKQCMKVAHALFNVAPIFGWSLLITNIGHIGYSTYSQGAGMKGLFYGQNDLTAAMSMLFPLLLYKFINKKSWISGVNIIAYLFSMFLIGTKTSYLFAIITPIIVVFLMRGGRSSKHSIRLIFNVIVVTLVLSLALIVTFTLFKSQLHNLYAYQMYFYTHSKSLSVYLLSGRTNTLPYLWTVLLSKPWVLFLGAGYQDGTDMLSSLAGAPTILEFDPLSLLLNGGLISVLVLLIVFSPVIKTFGRSRSALESVFLFSVTIGCFCSTLTGHVLASALAGTYLSVISGVYVGLRRWNVADSTYQPSKIPRGIFNVYEFSKSYSNTEKRYEVL